MPMATLAEFQTVFISAILLKNSLLKPYGVLKFREVITLSPFRVLQLGSDTQFAG